MRSQLKKKENARTAKHRTKLGVVRFARVRLKPPTLGSMKTSEKFKKNRTLAVNRKVWGSRAFARVRIKPPALGALKKIKKRNDSVLQSISYPQ